MNREVNVYEIALCQHTYTEYYMVTARSEAEARQYAANLPAVRTAAQITVSLKQQATQLQYPVGSIWHTGAFYTG